MNFKKGDIITGTKESDKAYNITNSNVIMKVVDFKRDSIVVKINRGDYYSVKYIVNPRYFKKINNNNITKL